MLCVERLTPHHAIIPTMQWVVDSDLWGAPRAFEHLGSVRTVNGRRLIPSDLADADGLIVRSVTQVNRALLEGTPVRFVGTATSGEDHIDLDYLRSRGIAYANAAGTNSRPVAEYVLAALFEWAWRTARPLAGATLGVFGRGRIGSIVADWADSLGMRVLCCDPPLAEAGAVDLHSAEGVLSQSDVVTLHVPLTRHGPCATAGLVNADWLARLPRQAWLINTSRGEVVNRQDLFDAIDAQRLAGAILDVWDGEPVADDALFSRATLLTPHLAGYSASAHRRASLRMIEAVEEFLAARGGASSSKSRSNPEPMNSIHPPEAEASFVEVRQLPPETDLAFISRILGITCDLPALDAEFRVRSKTVGAAAAFDAVRRAARARREMTDSALQLRPQSHAAARLLSRWGCRVEAAP